MRCPLDTVNYIKKSTCTYTCSSIFLFTLYTHVHVSVQKLIAKNIRQVKKNLTMCACKIYNVHTTSCSTCTCTVYMYTELESIGLQCSAQDNLSGGWILICI